MTATFRLHWRGKGCCGEHVRDVARRDHVCWSAARGTVHASVYLRRDGMWGWSIGDYRMVDMLDSGGSALRTARPHLGVALTRRAAQRRCVRVLRASVGMALAADLTAPGAAVRDGAPP